MSLMISRSALIRRFGLTVPEMRMLADLIARYPVLLPVDEDGNMPVLPAETAVREVMASSRGTGVTW